jgi:hypothetical protein
MKISKLDAINKKIIVDIPLTTTSGKTRVKQRDTIFGYGTPFASRQNKFNQKNYIEWQIGYDAVIPSNIKNFKAKDYKNYLANTKEFAHFVFDKNNSDIILEMIKIFGMLSASHKFDILAILQTIIDNCEL